MRTPSTLGMLRLLTGNVVVIHLETVLDYTLETGRLIAA